MQLIDILTRFSLLEWGTAPAPAGGDGLTETVPSQNAEAEPGTANGWTFLSLPKCHGQKGL